MKLRQILIVLIFSFSLSGFAEEAETGPTLYERLGGEEGITNILKKTMELHMANPQLKPYFQHLDHEWFLQSALSFFSCLLYTSPSPRDA